MPVPYLDLKKQHATIKEELMKSISKILDDAWFVGGPFIDEFEREFARRCASKHAVALNSGTLACKFAYKAVGFEPGDEILTTPNTFFATAEAAHFLGGTVSFVDIEPDTFNMSPTSLASAITPRTRIIVPVHLYGLPCDMDPILQIAQQKNIAVVEDACQSHFSTYKGRKVGSMGAAAAFSFYPSKNLGACGDAGAATTNDDTVCQTMKLLRDHGQSGRYVHTMFGENGRMSAIQAAALVIKMRHIDAWVQSRKRIGRLYNDMLLGVSGLRTQYVPPDRDHVYYMFVIQHPNRDHIADELEKNGIGYGFRGVKPLHLQDVFKGRFAKGDFPNAERFAEQMLALPIFPEMTEGQVAEVVGVIKDSV